MKKYLKDFDAWNPKKQALDKKADSTIPYFNEREVWFCGLGCNVGFEEDGKGEEFWRPVVIIRKYNKHLFTGIPLTSKLKTDHPFYFKAGEIDGREAMAILSQLRAYSSKRLINKIGMLPEEVFESMKKAASEYIFSS